MGSQQQYVTPRAGSPSGKLRRAAPGSSVLRDMVCRGGGFTMGRTHPVAGACYEVAGRLYWEDTIGRGQDGKTHRPVRSVKEVWRHMLG